MKIDYAFSLEKVHSIQRPKKLILISGPSGSGKSTCLRILAASLNIKIVEWETRTTSALTSTLLGEQRGQSLSIISVTLIVQDQSTTAAFFLYNSVSVIKHRFQWI